MSKIRNSNFAENEGILQRNESRKKKMKKNEWTKKKNELKKRDSKEWNGKDEEEKRFKEIEEAK